MVSCSVFEKEMEKRAFQMADAKDVVMVAVKTCGPVSVWCDL
jgi:hypothetical protein